MPHLLFLVMVRVPDENFGLRLLPFCALRMMSERRPGNPRGSRIFTGKTFCGDRKYPERGPPRRPGIPDTSRNLPSPPDSPHQDNHADRLDIRRRGYVLG